MSKKRKEDHIDLAKASQVNKSNFNLNYEPMLGAHPKKVDVSLDFLGFHFKAPFWFSSMTGGVDKGAIINQNLAKVAGKYKLGMGLGSCRSLLNSKERLGDFDVKEFMPDSPLYANIGIAQIEKVFSAHKSNLLNDLVNSLNADGLIIHVNPLQEWNQPEGDRYYNPPIETIKQALEETDIPLVVKEVGQGIGPKSLKSLCQLPLKAIEFSSLGGTNFTLLEHTRHLAVNSGKKSLNEHLAYIGHTKLEMISFINEMNSSDFKCREFIISGGVQNSVEGFSLINKLKKNSIIGFGSILLDYAMEFNKLDEFIHSEIENYKLSECLFEVKV